MERFYKLRIGETGKNVLKIFSGQSLSFVINILIGFFLLHYLTPKDFGLYGIPADFINIVVLGVLSLFTNTNQKFISEYMGRGEENKLRGILWFSLMYFLFWGILFFLIISIFAEYISGYIMRNPEYTYAFRLYSFGIPFLALSLFLSSVLNGFGRFKEVSLNDIIIPTISRAIFLILLLPVYPLKVFIAILSTNVKYFVNFLSNSWASLGILKLYISGRRDYDFKSWIRYGIPMCLKFWLGLLQDKIKPIFVGSIVGIFSGGVFKAASLISNGVYLLEVSVSNVLFIELSKDIGKGNFLGSALRIRGITFKMSLIMGVFSILSAVLGVLALRFFGKGYEKGGTVLAIIILGYYINSLSGLWQAFLQAAGRSDMVFLISLVYSVIDIILVIILIKPFGMLGAALSFPISAILITALRFYLFYTLSRIKPLELKTVIVSVVVGVMFLLIIPFIT